MKFQQILAIKFIRAKFKLLALFSRQKAAEKIFELFCTPFVKADKNIPPFFLAAAALTYTLNGLKIKGFCWNKGTGKKIMILHGFSSSAYKFHSYISHFAEIGYEVLAFNAPAHGNSEGKTVNVLEYTALINIVVKNHGPIDGFVAHSFGGLALCLALEKLPHTAETKVVLIAPATETTTAAEKAFEMLGIKNDLLRAAFDDVILKRSGKSTEWFSIKRAIKNINAAVLWVHDEDDDVTPLADALKVKEDHHANLQFIITKGLGHRNIYRSSDVKKQVFQFLTSY